MKLLIVLAACFLGLNLHAQKAPSPLMPDPDYDYVCFYCKQQMSSLPNTKAIFKLLPCIDKKRKISFCTEKHYLLAENKYCKAVSVRRSKKV